VAALRRPPELTTEQAAWIAGVEPVTVRLWVLRGHVRRTSRGLVDGESLMAYLDGRGEHGMHRKGDDDRPEPRATR